MGVQALTDAVIIVGAPRSGTNMLRDVLAGLPGMTTWPCDEINLLWKHGNRSVPHDELTPAHARPSVKSFLHREFAKQRKRGDSEMVVEKTCATSLRVAFAAEALPTAKFLFIRRDGIDAAASTAKRWNAAFEWRYTLRKARFVPVSDVPFYAGDVLRQRYKKAQVSGRGRPVTSWWGPKPADYQHLQRTVGLPDLAALQWQRCVEATVRDLHQLHPDRHMEVAYEDFVSRPEHGLREILAFVGRSEDFQAAAVQDVNAQSIGKARASLDPATRTRLEELVRPSLRRFGYG